MKCAEDRRVILFPHALSTLDSWEVLLEFLSTSPKHMIGILDTAHSATAEEGRKIF
jgi:hypothetical protein